MSTSSNNYFLPFGIYSTSTFVLSIVAATLTLIVTLTKIWVSRVQNLQFFLSDKLAIISSILLLGSLGLIIYYVSLPMTLYGTASEPSPGSHDQQVYLRAAFAIELLWPLSLALSKVSILLLFRRMFRSMRLRIGVVCTMIIVIALGITMVFGTIFQCFPVQTFWQGPSSSNPPVCINRQIFFLFTNIPNIFANIVIIALPIPELTRLQIRTSVKVFLWTIFLLGSAAVTASIVRLVEIARINGTDSATAKIGGGASVIVEATVSMLCAFLPTLCPALWRMRPMRNVTHSSRRRRGAGPPSKRYFLDNYDKPGDRFTGGRRWPRSLLRSRQDVTDTTKSLPREPSNPWLPSFGSLTPGQERRDAQLGGILVEKRVSTRVERRSQIEPALSRQLESMFNQQRRGSDANV